MVGRENLGLLAWGRISLEGLGLYPRYLLKEKGLRRDPGAFDF